MSIKITVITLDGKNLSRTRCRAQRLVDAGSHAWIGDRTVRELVPAKKAFALADRIIPRESPIFDPNYFYPDHTPHPELFDLPFNYPLPYELLRSYAS